MYIRYQNCLLIPLFFAASISASDTYYPSGEWQKTSPESQSIDQAKVNKIIDLSFTDESTQGIVIIKNGKIIGERYADGFDSKSHGTSWSMAKSYYAALIGISIEKGEIDSLDDPVGKYLDYFNGMRKSNWKSQWDNYGRFARTF